MTKSQVLLVLCFGALVGVSSAINCTDDFMEDLELGDCCEGPNWKDEEDTHKKCESENIACMSECFMKSSEGYVNGELDMPKMKAEIEKELADDPTYIPIIQEAFQICVDKLKPDRAKMEKTDEGCDTYPLMLFICVDAHNFLNCPADKWKSTPQCNQAKQYVVDCGWE